ncbi:hypothetical protein BJ878DRAFT_571142 [Calycina marina]|uniref:Uncharacterized protein n=1 Tax=Calycina marina TaxID=1763456 RepID=A0A9P7YV05_9HELO|nr:hypothetical protein BJ878DRAFT_571142 [Calycina marina]
MHVTYPAVRVSGNRLHHATAFIPTVSISNAFASVKWLRFMQTKHSSPAQSSQMFSVQSSRCRTSCPVVVCCAEILILGTVCQGLSFWTS